MFIEAVCLYISHILMCVFPIKYLNVTTSQNIFTCSFTQTFCLFRESYKPVSTLRGNANIFNLEAGGGHNVVFYRRHVWKREQLVSKFQCK